MNQRIVIAKNQNLNWQAILIEETQTQIKLQIKNLLLGKDGYKTYLQFRNQVIKTINETVKELENKDLKRNTAFALLRYAEKTLAEAMIAMGIPTNSLLLAFGYLKSGANFQQVIKPYKPTPTDKMARTIAQPTARYNKEYFNMVKPALKQIIDSEPMYDEHISLRNIAEMTVRYDDTLKKIDNLVRQGVNLVISSKHANCSKRCEHWQGGHYTLDNTYQNVDGIEFQPLSNATDQYYITKQGKVYKNGHITGYNCRHYLMAYKKGYEQPMVSAEVVAKEREIDHRMRYMERQIRHWKDTALIYKGEDQSMYERARAKAVEYNSRYIQYAKANKRAYYPSRTDVF